MEIADTPHHNEKTIHNKGWENVVDTNYLVTTIYTTSFVIPSFDTDVQYFINKLNNQGFVKA